MSKIDLNDISIKENEISVKEIHKESYAKSNAITGDKNYLYYRLRESFKKAEKIDIIVSFLMESGVKLILNDIKEAVDRGVSIRILTGNYLRITQPSALYLLKKEFKDKIELRFYNEPNRSFHPKSYMFQNKIDSEIYVGSSNISRGALTNSIEWNYRFLKSQNPYDFEEFYNTFEDLFYNHSIIVDDDVLERYSKSWVRPKVFKDIENSEDEYKKNSNSENNVIDLFEPKGAQIEALYALNNTREEGFDKALIVAATGIGKTYLAAFDSKDSHGVNSAAVYSGDNGEYAQERNSAINKLSKGELKVVFSVDMFNEGLDIPSIDMVMFLRPTQSPTVFLQQLGRGLRKFEDKKYLNVLDFIGNYKKADLLPFLLSGKTYSRADSKRGIPSEEEYPEDCRIDFDFRLIDIFKGLASKEMKIKDKIREEFLRVKDELGNRPSRVELFNNIDDEIYCEMKQKSKFNIFKDYLGFLKENNELTDEELEFMNTRGYDFIKMIETTSMSKSYKIPVLLAFYNNGNIKMSLDEDDIYNSFYEFYHKGSNKVDMLKDKRTSGFEKWEKKDYVKLAKDNPVKFLIKTESDFFKGTDENLIELYKDMENIINNNIIKEQMLDALTLRTNMYYEERNF